jgi:hypothetical protein
LFASYLSAAVKAVKAAMTAATALAATALEVFNIQKFKFLYPKTRIPRGLNMDVCTITTPSQPLVSAATPGALGSLGKCTSSNAL